MVFILSKYNPVISDCMSLRVPIYPTPAKPINAGETAKPTTLVAYDKFQEPNPISLHSRVTKSP